MSLPTIEQFDYMFEDSFKKEIKNRRKLKEFEKWDKLKLKTKIKRLEDDLKNNINYLQQKFYHDLDIIKKGGHPELGFMTDDDGCSTIQTHMDTDIFNHMVKMRNKRLKKHGKKLNI